MNRFAMERIKLYFGIEYNVHLLKVKFTRIVSRKMIELGHREFVVQPCAQPLPIGL